MNSKYKIVVIISLLLVTLSISITFINYFVSLNSTEKHLKNQSLPLSLDNIYTEIQKHLIEPYLVSSMMANDTFVQDWILNDELNGHRIQEYLDAVKNKYAMFTTFLVSEKTGNYYTQDGLLEKIDKENPNNAWYFRFKHIQENHEINLDFNQNLSNSLIMFINFKIFDKKYSYIGATGVALKISYINDMLKMFRQKYHFKVYFLDEKGDIVLCERDIIHEKNIDELSNLKKYKSEIISKEPLNFEYENNNKKVLLNTKYIPELNLYLLVEANLDDFIDDVKDIFYINLFVSLFFTFFVTGIIVYMIRKYNKKLEYLANNDLLTDINNRRIFDSKLEHLILIHQRHNQPINLLFLDIDNFKDINDKFGHAIGDKVLIRIASILKDNIRKSDLIARWGGEEFVIAYINSSVEDSLLTTEKLKDLIENDYILKDLNQGNITASFGLTTLKKGDKASDLINRADFAMYESKNSGKNRISIIN
ncbi:MAG: sensor domain-containing diguanylate cyclase [Aliarcobacter sp.]|nr:sensor domain-containing diguanylate cyclase [Aliarcobacter sp.]